ncbi:poly-beta-1,6-N-acetyl-D-glucosamine biosynthesis protein PgaD [Variovorax saccharolyticus]|uniref:poly-beta-1,6-N-acetyl-D-glucosamine biosynthesis protein PgaD n=1 Tax=Variovorax saccharolyticus TaxID=3053516 RepID=UPI0025781D3B|nr:poly-beta-1,6-N-acetyl-D-glucosamine biosynthesis protein PgaD [Variovorax sp. J22R187]MDM0018458.1 poly-beta-1,6-N-acetyl-D-glucosamine biosynthesis protein PgaD [Variovorax sp. J22R187]
MKQKTLAAPEPADAATAPELAPPSDWPPRILRARTQWWMRLRDLALTLLAWIIYLWFLREPVIAGIAWLSPTAGTYLEQVIEVPMAVDLRPYLWMAAGLMAWLGLAGLYQGRRLRQQPDSEREVPPLPPDAQFAAAGVTLPEQALWRQARCLRVEYDMHGRVLGAAQRPSERQRAQLALDDALARPQAQRQDHEGREGEH